MQLGAPTSGPDDDFNVLFDDVTDASVILEIDEKFCSSLFVLSEKFLLFWLFWLFWYHLAIFALGP